MTYAIWAYLAWTVLGWFVVVCTDPTKERKKFAPNTSKAVGIIARTIFVAFAIGLVVTRG